MSNQPDLKSSLPGIVYLRLTLVFFLLCVSFFASAGSINYWQAWVYLAILFIPALFAITWLMKHNPGLIERRMRYKEKEKVQQSIIKFTSIFYILIFLIPGFDKRFGWSSVPWFVVITSDIIMLTGYIIILFVFRENSYASRIIEVEAEQKVIDTGPYSVVRHPMYTGVILLYSFTPIALASYWAVIPALMVIPALVMRILNEEKILSKELKGYTEYMQRVKFRLIPGIW